jgi:hypothetical protein
MPLQQIRNVNFGRTKSNATGSSGVGYQLLDVAGSPSAPRTTTGVYQTAPGIYAAYITFPDDFRGQILWDTGTTFPTASYATEQYNVEENDPKVSLTHTAVTQMSGTVGSLYDIQFGRWKIDNNKMQFFKEDNLTLIAEFSLFDDNGNPTMDSVFERIKI